MVAEFTPYLIDANHIAVAVQCSTCAECGRNMIGDLHGRALSVYPRHALVDQLKRADVGRLSGRYNAAGRLLCADCAPVHARFHCVLCKEARAGTPQYSEGDPAEFLCVPCFEQRTAKEWDEAVQELRKNHRWDFE
jgi:hypothetical protein